MIYRWVSNVWSKFQMTHFLAQSIISIENLNNFMPFCPEFQDTRNEKLKIVEKSRNLEVETRRAATLLDPNFRFISVSTLIHHLRVKHLSVALGITSEETYAKIAPEFSDHIVEYDAENNDKITKIHSVL